MIDIENQTDFHIPSQMIQDIYTTLTTKDVDLLVTDDPHIKAINSEYRNIDKATDVLSFPFEDAPMAPLGSIVISCDHVILASEQYAHTVEDEFCLLFIHGILHLLGYDHETDRGEMRQKEKELIHQFSLPQSLIIRTLDHKE